MNINNYFLNSEKQQQQQVAIEPLPPRSRNAGGASPLRNKSVGV